VAVNAWLHDAGEEVERVGLEQLLDDFDRSMVRQQRSPATIKTYRWALEDLLKFLRGRGLDDAWSLDRLVLEDWQDSLVARKLTPGSRGTAAVAARVFLQYLAGRELCDQRLARYIERVHQPRHLPRPIPPADLARLKAFLAPRRPRMSLVALRDRALFWYLITTGARVSEALQVLRGEAERAIVWQKGGSQKVLRIPPGAAEMVADYLQARRDDCPWLWVTHDSNRPLRKLDAAGVREVWKRLCQRVGVAAFTTHQLRHTCATELLEAGVPELVVADWLGHHGLQTLHRYGQVRESQRQLALDAAEQLMQAPPRPRLLPRARKGRY
jgi:site-specific recombinase XerD